MAEGDPNNNDNGKQNSPLVKPLNEANAQFGAQPPASVALQVNMGDVNFHIPNLVALERLAKTSFELALKIVESSNIALKNDTRKYAWGAIASSLICLTILGCATSIIILKGFSAGMIFFLTCVVVCAIMTAVYTGKVQDISWTASFLGRAPSPPKDVD